MDAKKIDDKGIDRLRIAILVQAYKDMVDVKTKRINGSEYALEKFFRSEWAKDLMPDGINPEILIRQANQKKAEMMKEFEEEYMNDNTACKIIFNRSKHEVDNALERVGNIKALKCYLNGKIRKYNRVLKNKELEAENKKKAEIYTDVLEKLKEIAGGK